MRVTSVTFAVGSTNQPTTAPLSPTSRRPLESGTSMYSYAFNKGADIHMSDGGYIHYLDPSGSSCRPHRPHRNACNKYHQLIETIVYTGSMFCRVRDPGHNICQTSAIEGQLVFTWTAISLFSKPRRRSCIQEKTNHHRHTINKQQIVPNSRRFAYIAPKELLVISKRSRDFFWSASLLMLWGQPTNQQLKGFSQKFGTVCLWLVVEEREFVELVQATWVKYLDLLNSGAAAGWESGATPRPAMERPGSRGGGVVIRNSSPGRLGGRRGVRAPGRWETAAQPGVHNGPGHLYREGGSTTTAPLIPTSRRPLESGTSVYSCAFNRRADINMLDGG